jgi:DNA helicase-2/ATP-dependent DNA helicase PcrA
MILRRYGRAIGLDSSFTILDQGDSEDVIGILLDQTGLKKQGRSFPKKGTIHAIFTKAVNKELSIDTVIAKYYATIFRKLKN